MSRCKKVANPCKICLQSVNRRSGMQCQGACEAWAHFKCLNYTPGRVSDIKKGVITVTCPCPDCKTSVPKEFQTKAPFTCNNIQCPANHPPACDTAECQANTLTKAKPVPRAPPGTLRTCGVECRQFSGCKKFVASNISAARMTREMERQRLEKQRIKDLKEREMAEQEEMNRKALEMQALSTSDETDTSDSSRKKSKKKSMAQKKKSVKPAGGRGVCVQPGVKSPCGVQALLGTINELSEQINELMKHLKCASNREGCTGMTEKCGDKAEPATQQCLALVNPLRIGSEYPEESDDFRCMLEEQSRIQHVRFSQASLTSDSDYVNESNVASKACSCTIDSQEVGN